MSNPAPAEQDLRFMERAIWLARKGAGRVEPNPLVGCVVVKNGRVIGEGCHRRFGGPHAEVAALRTCQSSPEGATVYVSLEPCCHHGKTPPCVDALIAARVARVVVALRDPYPLVCGEGLRRLRAAGIAVDVGVGGVAAAELLAPFTTRHLLRRPYVIAKWAQSLDGRLAATGGDSRWISGEAARRRVHQLRARVDAILVGSGTVLADDPLLTARNVPVRRVALRVVLDGRLRIPERARLVRTARDFPTQVITSPRRAASDKARRLVRRGVEVVAANVRQERIDLAAMLSDLADSDVTNLLVEGGPTLLRAFLDAGLVDEALVFVAPLFLGGREDRYSVTGRTAQRMRDAARPRRIQSQRCGDDVLYRLRLTDPPAVPE
ncbi:MAG: bifunctional diaminohydroxyphosphoribosylaminopyrimidine deaminase/5-amino-6-(5-phosphoribosylamino)uracil reductase RibD [Planctomycetes bacterium]|nr:bifunctional diaminohydroxyphosphoribosylaminopyrimidine deaminase/5-amino-6-(5-phosphoribosylamino)uracil reductase RibD [Planctomycetota bacterium]